MQRITSIILIICFIQQLAGRVSLYIGYEINKEYVTLKYCENRMKPGSACRGKCYLAKKLAEGEKKEIPPAAHHKPIQEVQFVQGSRSLSDHALRQPVTICHSWPVIAFPTGEGDTLFHPPRV